MNVWGHHSAHSYSLVTSKNAVNTLRKALCTSWWPLAFFSLGLVLHYTLGAWK